MRDVLISEPFWRHLQGVPLTPAQREKEVVVCLQRGSRGRKDDPTFPGGKRDVNTNRAYN